MNPVSVIVNKINQTPKTKYNILTFPTHESYQTLLDSTGHKFYMLELPNAKTWDYRFKPLPPNHSFVDDIPTNIDFILTHERYTQLPTALNMQKGTRLPIVHMEHVEPILDLWTDEQFDQLKSMSGDVNVFITEHNKNSWGSMDDGHHVIRHAIDSDTFSDWRPNESKTVLYTVNNLKERDIFCGWSVWNQVKDMVQTTRPDIKFELIGDNPGISKPISCTKELVTKLQSCGCYFNSSQLSPIPMSLLEAMSVGCPIVSSSKQEIGRILKNTDCVYVGNNIEEMVKGIIFAIDNQEEAKKFGLNARDKIVKQFNLETFQKNWNFVFNQTYNLTIGDACLAN